MRFPFPKHFTILAAIAISLLLACNSEKASQGADANSTSASQSYSAARAAARLNSLASKMEGFLQDLPVDSTRIPRAVDEDGNVIGVKSRDWTSGFFPGTLWYLAEASQSDQLEQAARTWSEFIKKEQYDDHTHDLGFKVNNSLGKGLQLFGEEEYRDEVIQASRTLIERFNPNVGTIKSWDWGAKKGWVHPTIIDNMMNLEMLFDATRMTGDSVFYNVSTSHADVTLREHFRPDHSSYHVIDYDTLTGEVQNRHTHQGMSHESAWSRGQAWGLYGYTICYRYTRNPAYLEQAQRIANYFFEHPNMPADLIAYYDFDAEPGADTPRDVSASAVAASALLELQAYDPAHAAQYMAWADQVLATLETPAYQTQIAPFFLDHSTGSVPAPFEVDVPINYGDYYYVETLHRRAAINDQ
jgi:hypothetical protein